MMPNLVILIIRTKIVVSIDEIMNLLSLREVRNREMIKIHHTDNNNYKGKPQNILADNG